MKGKQIGTLYTTPDRLNGIQLILEQYSDPKYQRIVNGLVDGFIGFCIFKDVYDERQGNMVGGVILCDPSGNPIEREQYKLNDFTWAGNLGYTESVSFL